MKPCFSTLTSGFAPLVFRPSVAIQLRNGYSLPPNQTPMVLPLKSFGVLTPAAFLQVSIRPLRLKICETLTIGTPASRAASALGIQSTAMSAPLAASTCGGAMSGPPGLTVTSSPASL